MSGQSSLEASLQADFASTLTATLRREAHKNELALARIRMVVTFIYASLDVWLATAGTVVDGDPIPAPSAIVAVVSFSVSVLIFWLLRGRSDSNWWRYALPLVDGGIILAMTASLIMGVGPEAFREIGAIEATSAVCVLLAVSGGIRIAWSAAVVTTAMSLVILAVTAAWVGYSAISASYVGAAVIAAGLIGGWMTTVVKRSVEEQMRLSVLRRFVDTEVIEHAHDPMELMTRPRLLEATVAVTDLRGFTSISENLEPAEVLEFLNEFQGLLAATVSKYGGRIDKFLGDGMLAVFGATGQTSDHAEQGLRAAASILERMDEMNRERIACNLPELRIGIGLHTGRLVAGCLGFGGRLEFTVIGDTVNMASRLEALTKEEGVQVLISADCIAKVGRSRCNEIFGVRELVHLGETTLRGRGASTAIYGVR